jgi:hypothetical protein
MGTFQNILNNIMMYIIHIIMLSHNHQQTTVTAKSILTSTCIITFCTVYTLLSYVTIIDGHLVEF